MYKYSIEEEKNRYSPHILTISGISGYFLLSKILYSPVVNSFFIKKTGLTINQNFSTLSDS